MKRFSALLALCEGQKGMLGQNGTRGQNGIPGDLEKVCYVWFCCYVSMISVIGQCGLTQQNQT